MSRRPREPRVRNIHQMVKRHHVRHIHGRPLELRVRNIHQMVKRHHVRHIHGRPLEPRVRNIHQMAKRPRVRHIHGRLRVRLIREEETQIPTTHVAHTPKHEDTPMTPTCQMHQRPHEPHVRNIHLMAKRPHVRHIHGKPRVRHIHVAQTQKCALPRIH